MLQLGVVAATFGLIFVGELPDKTAIASLVLGTRFPWRWAFAGVAAAFLVHVLIAVAAGSLLTLLPNLAAKYHDALSVAVGATLALWAVALLAMLGGKTLLRFLPMKSITRIAAVVMVLLSIYSVLTAVGVLGS